MVMFINTKKAPFNVDYVDKLASICNLIYTDECNILREVSEIDEETKLTFHTNKLIYENIKCRLSYTSGSGSYIKGNATFTDTIANNNKNTKIFMATDVNVNIGDTLIVTRADYEYKYLVNSVPNVYSSHQEFYAELEDRGVKNGTWYNRKPI